ncbi:MAG TPA: hypothetical protein VNZ22_17115, partial [Bacillota bacterium]|nr:hypothetical protein [Bacillota bacterium]
MSKARLFGNGSPRAILKCSAKLLYQTSFVVGLVGAAALLAGGKLMAADIETTLFPGLATSKSVSVTLPARPPNADVLFSFDATSSMFDAIDTAKKNAIDLMNALQATGVNYRYGVASFMDYPGVYGGFCGYTNGGPVPYGDPKDYAYQLHQGMTANMSAVSTAINSLSLGSGADGPEAYTRALHESYADTNVMWRTGAKRVVVNFGDSVPHDCNLNAGIPDAYIFFATTGGDPGRDGVLGTLDDLDLQQVLAEMASNHVVLLAARLSSFGGGDPFFQYWTNWTAKTGGKAFQTSGGTLIKDLMQEITNSLVITCVSNLHVTVDPPAFSSWLTTVPTAYDQVWPGDTQEFSLVIKVPLGTPAGDYPFTLHVVDGQAVEFMIQSVVVHVLAQVPLPLALNNSNVTWTTDSSLPWFGQGNVSHDGVASARSFPIGDGEQTSLTTTILNGPGTLSFWW